MADPWYPVAFHFSVSISGASSSADGAFQEVGGLEAEMDLETVTEGGENRFVHRLPKAVKHPNLKLKRGLTPNNSDIVKWCKDALEVDLAKTIKPKDITISLLDEDASPAATWAITNAYPVKWSVGGRDAMKNELAIETIELAYNTLKRTL